MATKTKAARPTAPTPAGVDTPAQPAPAPPAAPAPAPARTYLVGAVPILHNGVLYGVGARIALADADAARLGVLITPAAA
jgi:hypothetical protein